MSEAEHKPTIMIAAGGTGGHVMPALAVAQCLNEYPVNIVWVGTATGFEATAVPQANFEFTTISATGLRGKNLLTLFLLPWRLSSAILRSLYLMIKYRPAIVLGMGGFVAAPIGLIAAALNIPLIIHEQNAIMGMTNRLLARLSKYVLLGFENTIKLSNTKYVGNPVRLDICALPEPEPRYRQRDGVIHLLVIGGSQGAVVFNTVVPSALALMEPGHRPQVRQQTGKNNLQAAREHAAALGVDIEFSDFFDDMAALYAWADLIICRAGAMSVAEIVAAGVASVLVPYPHAVDDHQTANAGILTECDAAILLPQKELIPSKLAALLEGFVDGRDDLMGMANRARQLADPNAGAEFARICMQEISA